MLSISDMMEAPKEGDKVKDKIVTTDKGSINLTVLKGAMVRLSEKGPTVCVEKTK